jgi:hypothetical protein
MVLAVNYYHSRLQRDENQLTQTVKSQSYGLGKAPDGNVLQIPDFEKPLGDPYTSERKYEIGKDEK